MEIDMLNKSTVKNFYHHESRSLHEVHSNNYCNMSNH